MSSTKRKMLQQVLIAAEYIENLIQHILFIRIENSSGEHKSRNRLAHSQVKLCLVAMGSVVVLQALKPIPFELHHGSCRNLDQKHQ